MAYKCAVNAHVDKKQSSSEQSSVAPSRTCCWEPGVLGLMLSVFVRGWNVV